MNRHFSPGNNVFEHYMAGEAESFARSLMASPALAAEWEDVRKRGWSQPPLTESERWHLWSSRPREAYQLTEESYGEAIGISYSAGYSEEYAQAWTKARADANLAVKRAGLRD